MESSEESESGKVTPFASDVVNYSSTPSAPLIIPIVFFTVLGIAIICGLIKLIISVWNRKRKSDTYVFVETLEEDKDHERLHYTIDSNSEGKLIPLTYVTVRKRPSNGNINENYDNNGSNLRVEANVHQLSPLNDSEDMNHTRDDTPLTHKNPIIATESDV